MTKVFHRQRLEEPLLVAVAGDGPYVIDEAGKRYIDGSCGAGVSCLGHSNQAVRDAIKRQVDQLAYAHTGFFTTRPLEALAEDLLSDAPSGLQHAWFANSGSEAIEAAIKMTRQYWVEVGRPEKRFIVGRRQGFVGSTLGALSVGGNEGRRELFAPVLLENVRHLDPCFFYRYARPGETPEEYGMRAAAQLETLILELGPDNVAAFVCETVVGATSGAVTAAPGYLREIRRICDQYQVLMVLDEVMCGMGRTGTRYACAQEQVAPDLLAVAKSLGSGYAPISSLLVSESIYQGFAQGSRLIRHGGTYQGHATSCAAALAVQREIRERNLLSNVRAMGGYLQSELARLFGDHPHIGDIRGRGLMFAMEFVRDRVTREPFDAAHQLAAKLKKTALANGLMCYPQSGTIDGVRGDHVMLLPPFIVERSHIDEIVDKLAASIATVLAGITP